MRLPVVLAAEIAAVAVGLEGVVIEEVQETFVFVELALVVLEALSSLRMDCVGVLVGP